MLGADGVFENEYEAQPIYLNRDTVSTVSEYNGTVYAKYRVTRKGGVTESQGSVEPLDVAEVHALDVVFGVSAPMGRLLVVGTVQSVLDALWPPPCPDARATGVSVQVTHGVYELQGDCGGDRYISSATGAVVLDPARLEGDEWTVARIADTDGRHRFSLVITTPTTFTLQRWVPPAEPDGTGSWNDITATVADVQAQTRLRPKPSA